MRIRAANMGDANWIVALLIEGASAGHFLPTVAAQAPYLVGAALGPGVIKMRKLRNGMQRDVSIKVTAIVAEINGVPASFQISLHEGNEVELHMAATHKKFRRKGCLKALIQSELDKYTPLGLRIYSRCYKKSTWAIAVLQSKGFSVTTKGEPLELDYVYPSAPVAAPSPSVSASASDQQTILQRLSKWIRSAF